MLRKLSTSLARAAWVRKAALSTPGVRDLAWRFIAGEDLDAGAAVVRGLNGRGIKATLNFVGTHVRTEAEAVAAADAAIASVVRIRRDGLDANVSVKLTHLGLDVREALARAQLRRVLEAARAAGVFVRIDMEESPYVDRTLAIFEEVRAAYGPDTVGIVVQSYFRNRAADLERLVAAGARVRLVKGGYWEPPEIVYRRQADIDAAFARDLELLLRRGRLPAIATHDPAMIDRARRVAGEAGLARDRWELQMLYGVRPDLQAEAVRAGHVVRAYVPYGGHWYEYALGCIRRMPASALRRIAERRARAEA